MELRRNLFVRNVPIMRRKRISLHTEGTYPALCAQIERAEGVEHGAARRLAGDGLILQ